MPARLTETQIQKLIGNISDGLFLLTGLRPCMGAEIEFYLKGDGDCISLVLDSIGSRFGEVEKEKGQGQYECVVNHTFDLLSLAGEIKSLKGFVEEVARQSSVEAIFAAKPFVDDYGSALHLHLSLHRHDGLNVFSAGKLEENQLLQQAIAGILDLTRDGIYLLCEGDQDYQRFAPNFLAPTKISWGGNNRTTVIRIPDSLPESRRLEYRVAPSSCGPEKVILLLLLGAYHGIKNQLEAPPRIWGNASDAQYPLDILPTCHSHAQNIYLTRKRP